MAGGGGAPVADSGAEQGATARGAAVGVAGTMGDGEIMLMGGAVCSVWAVWKEENDGKSSSGSGKRGVLLSRRTGAHQFAVLLEQTSAAKT